MSYPGPLYEYRGGAIAPDQYTPRLVDEQNSQDNFRNPTSSWNTSLGSQVSSIRRDVDTYERINSSEMDLDSLDNVESVSTSPISNSTFPDDWTDVMPFDQPYQIAPPMHQSPVEPIWQMEQDNGMLAFDLGPQSSTRTPLIFQETQNAWDDHDHLDHDRNYQRSAFSHGPSTLLRPSSTHDPPWTVVQPRGSIAPTSDVGIFDPASDAAISSQFSPTMGLGETALPASRAYPLASGSVGFGSPLSAHSMTVGISISPSEDTSFMESNVNFTMEATQTQTQQMIKSNSLNSMDAAFSSVSPRPQVALPSDYHVSRPQQVRQNAMLPENAFSYASSSASPSPSLTQAFPTPQPPSESPGPDVKLSRAPHRSVRTAHSSRPGGRPLGSHLLPKVAADANRMRKVVACWHCVLQRDKCGPGDVCDRCRKRALRPNTEFGLGCCRTSIRDLFGCFLPHLVTSMYNQETVKKFCSSHIRVWGNVEVTIKLVCGHRLPPFECPVYEFTPLDNELLRSYQYRTDPVTGQYVREEKWSPPLGLQQQSLKDEQMYDRFVDRIVTNHLPAFARMLYAGQKDDFALRLFQLMIQLKLQDQREAKLLKDVFRLIVLSYIMDHTFAIMDETKATLSKLNWQPPGTYPRYCSPRMASRQIKFLFSVLHRRAVQEVLNNLQQIFHSSGKGSPRWTEAFCAVLGLAIASEEIQRSIHIVMDARASAENIPKNKAISFAEEACREIDQRFLFVMDIFKWKYRRMDSPLTNWSQDWSTKLKDPSVVEFTKNIVMLVKEKSDYLSTRQFVDVSEGSVGKYASRLVARFLLSFWPPT